ncbi:hypothetical protein ACQ4PT_042856 [Festuca glaucescens]
MEADGLDDFYKLHQFKPSKEDAVTYYLPRLLAGSPLPHGSDRIIRQADVYTCEPKDLAAEYAPVPSAVSTGDRFFFTTCKHKSGSDTRIARVAGTGTWAVQKTETVYDEGGKVGEVKHLSFKKGKVSTGWVMEEYRCLRPEAVFAGGEKVLCKIHLAPNACAAARQESAAYTLRQERAEPAPAPQAETVTASARAQKRPAPVSAAADTPCSKKMRMEASVPISDQEEYEDCPVWFTPAAPVSLPAASTEVHDEPEADDDMGRLSCTMNELFGGQTLPMEAEEQLDFDWESIDPVDLLRPWDDDWKSEAQEEQTLPIEAKNNIEQIVIEKPAPSIDWEFSEELQCLLANHDAEEAVLYKRCNHNTAAANLHAPSLQGQQNQFFSFAAVN